MSIGGHTLSRKTTRALGAALALLALPLATRADWPLRRHDPARTAASTAVAQLARPAIAWRHYLGGSVSNGQLTSADVNGDGVVELVFLAGGRLLARRADDTVLWESPPMDLTRLDAVRDLDGDGTLDVVATGTGLVAVFHGRTGALSWRTADDAFGPTIGAVRLADLDRDGRDDLYVADHACGSTDSLGDVAIAYTFARGFGTARVEQPWHRLWASQREGGTLERGRDYQCGGDDALADLTGDGAPEVIAFGQRHVYVFDGRTGAKLASSEGDAGASRGGYDLGFTLPYGHLTTAVAELDGDPGQELVGLSNNNYAPTINSRLAVALDWDASRPPESRLRVLWTRRVDPETGRHGFTHSSVTDLDGDGRAEVTSTFVEGGVTRTLVLSGATGAVLATLPGVELLGIEPLAEGAPPTVLVRRGATLEGYRFPSFVPDAGAPSPSFTLASGSPTSWVDRARSLRMSAAARLTTAPLPAPSPATRRGLLLLQASAGIQSLESWDVGESPPRRVASYALPAEVTTVAAAGETGVAAPGPGLLLARSDGYLVVLDPSLRTINFGGVEIDLPGVRTGGYYSGRSGLGATAVAARFAGSVNELVVSNSRGILARLDASEATLTRAPAVRWQWPSAVAPLLLDLDGNGTCDRVVALQGSAVVARGADGATPAFSVPMLTGRQGFHGDVVPVRTASGLRFAVALSDSADGQGTVALTDGARKLWDQPQPPITVAGSGFGVLAVEELDGDTSAQDLVVDMQSTLRLHEGSSGRVLGAGIPNFSQIPMGVRGRAGAVTLLAGASVHAPRGVTVTPGPRTDAGVSSVTVSEAWAFPSDFRATSVGGALALCASEPRYAQARYASSRFVLARVDTGALVGDVALAGGRIFSNEQEALRAGTIPGFLGNASAIRELSPGRAGVLVGSTDGWLYALDPCASPPTLVWSLDFRAPVGEPILADTDGDGYDEVVVSVADGFLYGVDTERFPAPAWVRDTDPRGTNTDDVDEVRGSELAVSWSAVPGATGYEWACFTAGGTALSRNPSDMRNYFVHVPAGTTSARHASGLVSGGRYFFAVRALGAGGSSSEVTSDGVLFVRAISPLPDAGPTADGSVTSDRPAVDAPLTDAGVRDGALDATARDGGGQAPTESGCGCRVPGRAGGEGALGVLSALAALAAFTRRRRGATGTPWS